MSLKIGGSKSKSSMSSTSTTNSNSSFNSTTRPIVPEWASSLTQNVAARVGDLGRIDPQSLVAGVHPLQTEAAIRADDLSGSPWNFDAAADRTRYVMGADAPRTSAVQATPYIQQYMDPYLHDVVGAAEADLGANEGRVRAQQDLDLAGAGAFGGSGAALTKAMTEGELARARATTLSGLRSAGYTQALGAAQQDAQRAQDTNNINAQLYAQQLERGLAAARQLGDLSTSYDANQRANIGAQAQMGDVLRGIEQQQLQAPVTSTQQIVAMLSGLPIQLFTGQQQDGSQTGTSTTNSSGTQKGSGFNWGAGADFSGLLPGGNGQVTGIPL